MEQNTQTTKLPRPRAARFPRDFCMVLAGQIISLFGNAILRFALPLYLLRETGSSALFGAVTAMSFLPMIILSLFGGVIADRVNKRNIMVALDFGTAALIALFYLALGRLPLVVLLLVTLMALYGISGAYAPSVQASIPALVDSGGLMRANAAVNMVSTLAGLLGPVCGGVLFAAWGIRVILLVSIACFLASAIMEIFIHIPFQRRAAAHGALAAVKADLGESWRFMKQEKPVFFSILWVLACFNLVLSAALIVGMPVLIVNTLKMSDTALGFVQGAQGMGGLLGGVCAGVFAARFQPRHGPVFLMVCSAAALCIGLCLLPRIPPPVSYGVIVAANLAAMAVATLFSVQLFTLLQQQTPAHLTGKIIALFTAFAGCFQPLGQALYGVLFDVFSGAAWVVMLLAAFLSLLVALCSRRAFARL